MRALLLGLAVAAAANGYAAPAAAVDPGQMAFSGSSGVTIHSGKSFGGRRDGGFRRHRGNHGNGGLLIYDRDYQGDTAWRSDSFNDWWHDRPDRAYPRWMVSNQECDRQWYQGNVLRC